MLTLTNVNWFPLKIVISEQGCTLIIESNKIPGTPLQPATCEGTRYVALSRTIQDACNMHNTLVMCDHPNILKPIGVWTDPSDNRKAYIAVTSVDNALNNLAKEQLFCIEGRICRGFSALGFRMFKYANELSLHFRTITGHHYSFLESNTCFSGTFSRQYSMSIVDMREALHPVTTTLPLFNCFRWC